MSNPTFTFGNSFGATPAAAPSATAAPDVVKETTTRDFVRDVIEASQKTPVLVDFWAAWCGPCRAMAPEFEKAAQLLKGRARLAKIDTEREPAASQRWNIRGIPAFILFRNGREIAREAGARPAGDLVRFVDTAVPRS